MSEEKKPMSRSEREAQIKDRAGFVIVVLAALLAINTMIGGQNSSKTMNNTIAANNQWAWYQARRIVAHRPGSGGGAAFRAGYRYAVSSGQKVE